MFRGSIFSECHAHVLKQLSPAGRGSPHAAGAPPPPPPPASAGAKSGVTLQQGCCFFKDGVVFKNSKLRERVGVTMM